MKFEFTCEPDGKDVYPVSATTRDVVVWEKKGKDRAVSNLLGGQIRMADLYELAYIASRRKGLFAGTLSDFEETVDVTSGGDEEEGPTSPAP